MSFPPIINSKDRHIWAYNQNGVYSVKSGSWLLSQQRGMINPEPDQNREINTLKSKVWDLRTLPKIKLFIWRALSGALAVAECLRNHGLQVHLQCGLCHGGDETINHVLFSCWPATKVWEIANIPLPRHGFSTSWLLWGIWKHRNEFLYADTRGNLDLLVAEALSESALWLHLKDSSTEGRPQQAQRVGTGSRWLRPPQQIMKCNVHASWVSASTMCGGAWITRNHLGEATFHAREVFLANSNRIAAELRCIVWALQGLSDLRISRIEVWSDCSAAIEAILDPGNWPRYHTFTTRIHFWISKFQKISFHTSTVKSNRVAREIATSVTRDGRYQAYLARGGPSWLHTRLEEDKHGGI